MGTRNGVGKQKRKARVGFQIPSIQSHNGEKTLLDPRGQSTGKDMDLQHGVPSAIKH